MQVPLSNPWLFEVDAISKEDHLFAEFVHIAYSLCKRAEGLHEQPCPHSTRHHSTRDFKK
jgi:hypothetical protein